MAPESKLSELKTPGLVLDVDRVKHNAARVSNIAKQNGVRLRPHIKTHKCIEVGRIATDGHDGAVTASTLAEVKAFAQHGFSDFTYAVPIEPGKFSEVAEIVRGGVRLNVITDDLETSRSLAEFAAHENVRISAFVKIDSGYHRCGVAPDSDEATSIPQLIGSSSNLDFAGLLTHAGHSYHAGSIEGIREIARQERDVMVDLAERIRFDGIEVPTVSIGSTPTINHIDHLKGIDEVRPGNYIFFDAFQATVGSCSFADCALTVLTAVTHRSFDQKKVIVDAGAIALSKDRGPVEFDKGCGYGRVLSLEGEETGLRVSSVSQEHGTIFVEDDAMLERLSVGSRVRILANHSCLAAAQHEYYNVLQGSEIVDRWKIYRGW